MDLQLVPQSRTHAGEQFVHSERLCQIIVGTEIERLNFSGLITAARQHHDRNAVVAPADHAAVSSASDAAGIGSLMVSTAPFRSMRLVAEIVPCIASTKPRDIASPRPVPGRTWSPFC